MSFVMERLGDVNTSSLTRGELSAALLMTAIGFYWEGRDSAADFYTRLALRAAGDMFHSAAYAGRWHS